MFSAERILDFWSSQTDDNIKFDAHPILEVADYENKCVPYFLHGDGGEYQKRDSITIASMLGVRPTGSTKDTVLFLWGWPYAVASKDTVNIDRDSKQKLWKIIAWSCNALWEGVHPYRDWDNKDWPAGHPRRKLAGQWIHPAGLRGVCWGILGDHDFFNKDNMLPHVKYQRKLKIQLK